MKKENDLLDYMEEIAKNKIQKLRESYKVNKIFDNFLYKECKKILAILVFPYLKFETLLECVKDIKNNNKMYYPQTDVKRINIIYKKLQKICLHLNVALDEYYQMLTYIEKP